jgi:hypothetical protein
MRNHNGGAKRRAGRRAARCSLVGTDPHPPWCSAYSRPGCNDSSGRSGRVRSGSAGSATSLSRLRRGLSQVGNPAPPTPRSGGSARTWRPCLAGDARGAARLQRSRPSLPRRHGGHGALALAIRAIRVGVGQPQPEASGLRKIRTTARTLAALSVTTGLPSDDACIGPRRSDRGRRPRRSGRGLLARGTTRIARRPEPSQISRRVGRTSTPPSSRTSTETRRSTPDTRGGR